MSAKTIDSMNSDDNNGSIETPRRGQRCKKMSLKAMESHYLQQLKSASSFPESSRSSSSSDTSENEYNGTGEMCKSTILHQSETIGGGKIFSFQKRKARNSLAQKAFEIREMIPKTPRHVRTKLKKQLVSNVMDSSSEHDFSDSGSEYKASEDSTSSESESSDNVNSDSVDSSSDYTEQPKQPSQREAKLNVTLPLKKKIGEKIKNKKYIIKTDDYFSSHSSKKILTSNHSLDKLQTPRLPQDQLKSLMEKLKLSKEHDKCVKELSQTCETYFDKWFYLMQEGFNILLYGLGCKRHLLKRFQEHCLKNLPVIVVNGFFPTISIKDLLDAIIISLLELKDSPSNVYEACELIREQFNYFPDTHLYLIVHNIDGEMLRGKKSQDVLSRLASLRNIHLLTSIDHINASLIWDHAKLSKFNYTWWDVTSFFPYIEETSFESSLLVQGTGTLALSSLRNVFLSLTTNSKGIYLIIVKHQLENTKNQYYQGLAFKDLYWSCREAFLVSSDLALRAQLTEFVDHKMVKYKRSVDGTEHVVIPIASTLLKKFLDEQLK